MLLLDSFLLIRATLQALIYPLKLPRLPNVTQLQKLSIAGKIVLLLEPKANRSAAEDSLKQPHTPHPGSKRKHTQNSSVFFKETKSSEFSLHRS